MKINSILKSTALILSVFINQSFAASILFYFENENSGNIAIVNNKENNKDKKDDIEVIAVINFDTLDDIPNLLNNSNGPFRVESVSKEILSDNEEYIKIKGCHEIDENGGIKLSCRIAVYGNDNNDGYKPCISIVKPNNVPEMLYELSTSDVLKTKLDAHVKMGGNKKGISLNKLKEILELYKN